MTVEYDLPNFRVTHSFRKGNFKSYVGVITLRKKLKIAAYAGCAHKRETVAKRPYRRR